MPAPHLDDVLLRTARADDEADLVRLAALDSARPLPGPALVAEADGTIVAALCLTTGRAVADPFTCSLHLVAFLRRVQEARGRSRGPWRRDRPRIGVHALRRRYSPGG